MLTSKPGAFLPLIPLDVRVCQCVPALFRQPQCPFNFKAKTGRPHLLAAASITPKIPRVVAAALLSACYFVVQAPTFSHAAVVDEFQDISGQEIVKGADSSEIETEQQLREKTQRNTRLSGRLAQQFSSAKRIAESGDIDAALAAYDNLIKEAPNFAPGYSNRANLLIAKSRMNEALADYNRALELAPADGDVWVVLVNRGVTRLAVDDSSAGAEAALADLNAAFDRKGGDALVLQNRAAVYEALGKWESAIRDYQGALKSNDVKPFWLRYALVLFQEGKLSESIAVLKRVSNSFNVDDVKAALAVVYFENGNLGSAETLWSDMERPRLFESRQFLLSRKWPPRAVEAMDHFKSLKN